MTKPSTLHVIGSRYYGPDRNSHPYLNLYPTLGASVVAFLRGVISVVYLRGAGPGYRDWSRLGGGVRARQLHLHAVDATQCVN